MAVTNGPNLGLAVNGAQGDQHFTQLMAQWRGLDALVQAHVKSRTTTAQPASPADGDCYIIPSGAIGAAWSGQTNKIGRYTSVTPGWEFYTPKKGWRANVEDEGLPYSYSGSYWLPEESIGKIDGLKLSWNSGTSISVSTGVAYVPGAGGMVPVTSALTLSGLTLAASTFYHVYLYLNAGVAAIECVTTAPAAPYYGTARTKTGDTSRRYVGSVRSDSSGNILQFIQYKNFIEYTLRAGDANTRILSNGVATTSTTVSAAPAIPSTAVQIFALFQNTDTSNFAGISVLGGPDLNTNPAGLYYLATGLRITGILQVDSSQQITYRMQSAAPTSGLYIDVRGYTFEM